MDQSGEQVSDSKCLYTQHRVSEGVARDGSGWVCCYSQMNSLMASSNLISRPDWAVAEVSRVTRPFREYSKAHVSSGGRKACMGIHS